MTAQQVRIRSHVLGRVGMILDLIVYKHSIFATPFALASLLVATDGRPSARVLGWVLVALVSARSAAMAFNRLADQELDAINPRTAGRHLPQGLLRRSEVWGFVLAAAAVFILACAMLNTLCFALSPAALAIILLYSYTKRFTSLSHYALGLCLSIAPTGAWIAATGCFAIPPLILAGAVVLWVGGFDILYACQDIEFDRQVGLRSIPAAIGVPRALWVARVGHTAMLGILAAFGAVTGLGAVYFGGVLVVGLLLLYEHSLVRANDLSRVNTAFFTVNGIISILYLVVTAADVALRGGS